MFGFFRKKKLKDKPVIGVVPTRYPTTVDTAKAELHLSHRMACESSLSLAYWQAAERAAEDGIMDLYEEYSKLADEHGTRHDDLEAMHGEHAQRD